MGRDIKPPCWIDGMPETEYLADPCDVPSLSQSIANTLLDHSPWHAYREHPRLGGKVSTSSDAQDRGSIVHALLLGDRDRIEVLDVDGYRTKAAQDARDSAIASGKLPVKRALFDECEAEANELASQLLHMGIVVNAPRMRRERAAIWHEEGVLCRARMDCVDTEAGIVYDLKTTKKATDEALERSIRDYGYHVQAAAYTSAYAAIEPNMAGRVRFVLLFLESDTLQVVPVEIAGTLLEIGERRWKRAVDAWGRCLKAGKWPGYAPHGTRRIDCGEWAMGKDDDESRVLRERMNGI